jgi:hypothetical protein
MDSTAMNPANDEWKNTDWDSKDWAPSPELLAAYFDGEFECRDDLARLRARLERWLTEHPEAREELAEYHRLRQLWQETTPADPLPARWDHLLDELASRRLHGSAAVGWRPGWSWTWKAAALAGIAACVALLVNAVVNRAIVPNDPPALVQDDEPFPVATAEEIVVLRVEGADTGSLVVGQLPLQGPLELIGPNDFTLTSVQPHPRDNMVPHVRVGGTRSPMIWAKLDSDEP